MINLDLLPEIQKLDKANILGSIERIPEQIRQAWDEVSAVDLPKSYSQTENIVVCGMGGSALPGRVADALTTLQIHAPMEIFTEFKLPNYVNNKTLIILSSYSGNTEETIAVADDAINRKAKIFGIATGGKLAQLLQKEKIPSYIFDPKNNPSGQPRMSLGYSITTVLALLSKLSFISVNREQIENLIQTVDKLGKEYGVRTPESKNIAKAIAKKIHNHALMIIASEHLSGVAHAFKNQVNENSKTFSASFDIPELNHHLLEGLKFPSKAREILFFLFLESSHYYEKVLKRYPITADVIKKNGYEYAVYKTVSESKLEEVFEILVLGSYISFYLAILNNINPGPIPWVDYFKAKLS